MVSNEKNKKAYVADGTVGPYTYDFRIDDQTDLLVIETDPATGADLTKTLTTHYTVSGVGSDAGGSVTFTSVGVAPALNKRLTLARKVTATQPNDLPINGALPSDNIEKMLDRCAFLAQQQNREVECALRVPITDPNPPPALAAAEIRANKYLAFDANGDPVYLDTSIDGSTPVAAFPATLLDDTNADAVIKTLVDGATVETSIQPVDIVMLKDNSANNGRVATVTNLLNSMNLLTEDTTPAHLTDYVLEFNVAANSVRKSKFSNWRANSYLRASATATGTNVDFTSLPAGLERITIYVGSASFNGSDTLLFQLGDSGGFEVADYFGSYTMLTNAAAVATAALPSSGFAFGPWIAAEAMIGTVTFIRFSGNTWTCHGILAEGGATKQAICSGVKTLSDTLTGIRISRSGANSFDGGSFQLKAEF